MSKRTNKYRWREPQIEQRLPIAERWIFLLQNDFDNIPTAPWFDIQGRIIPNHTDLPAHLQNVEPTAPSPIRRILRRTQRAKRREKHAEALQAPLPTLPVPELQAHEDFYPDNPEDWIDVTEEASQDNLLLTHAVNVPSRTVFALAEVNPRTVQTVMC